MNSLDRKLLLFCDECGKPIRERAVVNMLTLDGWHEKCHEKMTRRQEMAARTRGIEAAVKPEMVISKFSGMPLYFCPKCHGQIYPWKEQCSCGQRMAWTREDER